MSRFDLEGVVFDVDGVLFDTERLSQETWNAVSTELNWPQVGRAYLEFVGQNRADILQKMLDLFGPDRFIYGTDFPIFRMKARRTVENGFYINEIPQGSLGDVSADPHMREIPYPEAEQITFFIYEEIAACRRACQSLRLGKDAVENIFYRNSARIFGI